VQVKVVKFNKGLLALRLTVVIACAVALSMATRGLLSKPRGMAYEYNAVYTILDIRGDGLRVVPVIAGNPGRGEYFDRMMVRLKPIAAINGTYFDPEYRTLGDIVIDGKVVQRGCQRQGIGFTPGGGIGFLERRGSRRIDWRGYESGIAAGPRLVRNGKGDIDVVRDGFKPAAATKKAPRSVIGATKDGRLILCVVKDSVDLRTTARIMLELGAHNAVNLDGGMSCALYSRGKSLDTPVVALSNIIVVVPRKK